MASTPGGKHGILQLNRAALQSVRQVCSTFNQYKGIEHMREERWHPHLVVSTEPCSLTEQHCKVQSVRQVCSTFNQYKGNEHMREGRWHPHLVVIKEPCSLTERQCRVKDEYAARFTEVHTH